MLDGTTRPRRTIALTLALGLLVVPLTADAQPAGKIARIGVLWEDTPRPHRRAGPPPGGPHRGPGSGLDSGGAAREQHDSDCAGDGRRACASRTPPTCKKPRRCWTRSRNATPANTLLLPYHDGCVCSNLLSAKHLHEYQPEMPMNARCNHVSEKPVVWQDLRPTGEDAQGLPDWASTSLTIGGRHP